MRIKSARRISMALIALFLVGACLPDVGAQTRRRKRSRRVTNPIVRTTPADSSATTGEAGAQQPSASDPQIISTAEDQLNETGGGATPSTSGSGTRRAGTRTRSGATEADPDSTRRTINRLSTQVNQLTDKLSQMEEQQRTLVNLERLSRAEQRAENLRAQLRDVQSKEADLQARLEQVEFALQPENLDNALAGYGSTRPEQLRDQRRRQLESERTRVRAQLDQLATGRTHLESAIANADAETDRIRQLVDAQGNGAATTATDATNGTNTNTDANTTNNNAPQPDRPVSSPPATSAGSPPLR